MTTATGMTAARVAVCAIGAVAGFCSPAAGQGVTLYFDASSTAPSFGETISWTVSASFTGYDDPTAYFGGFVGSFRAFDSSVGVASNFQNLMSGEGTPPVASGADIDMVNIFNAALLGTDDQANPINIFTFDFNWTTPGRVSYDAEGVVSIFPDDGIFTLTEEFTDFEVVSDVIILPMPGSAGVLAVGGVLCVTRRRRA